MARKRSKRLTTNSPQKQVRADWKHEDEVETLAWLDYNLSTNKDARAFKSSVVDHLGKTRLAKYTIGQIERKVRKFWNDTGSDDSTDRDEIYRLGTACLEHLPLNFKEEIYKRVSTLTDQALAETLSSQRQLRSASRTTDSELARHICPGVVVANILSPRKRQREVLSSSAAKDNSSPGKRKRQAAQGPADSAGQTLPKQEDRDDALQQPFIRLIVADSEDGLTDNDDCDTPTDRPIGEHRRESPQGALPVVDNSQTSREDETERSRKPRLVGEQQDVDVEHLQRELSLSKERCGSLQTQLEDMQRQHEAATRFLYNQLSQAQKNCKDLQRQVACLEYAYPELSRADDTSIIKTLNDKQKQIGELEECLKDRSWLRTFSTLSSTDPMRLDTRNVQAEMAFIGSRIKQILSEYEDHEVRITPNLEGQDDLKSLFCRSFGLNLSEPIDLISQGINSSTLSFQAVIRALTASALCEWVFESDLQEISVKPCALLEKYRLHLAKQDGKIALRNLDFAAHKSLIEEDFFQQHVIPRKATVLADRLSHTLAPFFAREESLEDSHADAFKAWPKEKAHLIEIFDRALRFKANVVVSKDLFEMVLYTPGTPFDKDVMEAETMEGDRAKLPFYETPKVKLCLLPSFHVYDHDRNTVEYNNFIQRDGSQRAGAYKLTKAVVILENLQATNG